ncbi:MAG: ribosomal L7Ae/L30e/S12e/Gadd45 family protein [Peptostreptococcaceae bacterium]|nr:ribosomal L7Ae/L30e/S12e/Gadd45 family protein [Peptostreptococcaceae bacterium]MDY5739724.1 ribosomal L7Ae/L30e/S12e/Gadd45 family protein [Anaerovoracaceae bacterium]SFE36037.1 Ribosomal protein L7Ae [Peptostreptococcaceae bacterium pGA-8]
MIKKNKINSYLGFAAKSKNLVAGQGIVLDKIKHRKAKLVIIAEDVGDNTRKKIINKCNSNNIAVKNYGLCDQLSQMTGKSEKGVFAILDDNFAQVILREIDQIQSEREEF